jgi:hypothetical protein
MGFSFSAADSRAGAVADEEGRAEGEVFAEEEALADDVVTAAARGETLPETPPETEAAGPPADRLASPAPDRRVGGAAVAPVAARVGVGTALPAAALPLTDTAAPLPFSDTTCAAPAAGSDAFVLLVVTAVILAL